MKSRLTCHPDAGIACFEWCPFLTLVFRASLPCQLIALVFGAVVACASQPARTTGQSETFLRIHLAASNPDGASTQWIATPTGRLLIEKQPIVTSRDVASADIAPYDGAKDRWGVVVTLVPAAQTTLQGRAEDYVDRQIAVVLDGACLNAPQVFSPLGPKVFISPPGGFSIDEARALQSRLQTDARTP